MSTPRPGISHLSLSSVPLSLLHDGEEIGKATGFIVLSAGSKFLVSNWHVYAGKSAATGEYLDPQGRMPDALTMKLFVDVDGEHVTDREFTVPLFLRNEPDAPPDVLWRQHSAFGSSVDVAVLPLPDKLQLIHDPLDLRKPHHAGNPELTLRISVPDRVVIIGYPFGVDGGLPNIGVWVQGHIASEYSLDYGGLPRFLVDARTREGMSGSPVHFYPRGARAYFDNNTYDYLDPDASVLLGVYSGRVHEDSDIGSVWRAEAIEEILESGVPGFPFV